MQPGQHGVSGQIKHMFVMMQQNIDTGNAMEVHQNNTMDMMLKTLSRLHLFKESLFLNQLLNMEEIDVVNPILGM